MSEVGLGELIEGIPSKDTNTPIIAQGATAIGIDPEQLGYVGSKFNEIFKKCHSSRNGLVLVEGITFAIGSRDAGNPAWREHAAQSARELFDHWGRANPAKISSAFCLVFLQRYPNFPRYNKDNDQHDAWYETMADYYHYFSSICHQDTIGTLFRMRDLGDPRARPGDDSDDKFIKHTVQYIEFLDRFFRESLGEV